MLLCCIVYVMLRATVRWALPWSLPNSFDSAIAAAAVANADGLLLIWEDWGPAPCSFG